jgi:mannose-6-phosphate isomerase-like protein (cupin superfamily)
MSIDKEHLEFHAVDLGVGWRRPAGYPDGIQEKILAGALDEKAKVGNRTRLLRFEPGARTTLPVVHDYWEEVFLLSGDLVVGDDSTGPKAYGPNTYACRPPGVSHGPFRSTDGCLLFEIHYYDPGGDGSRAHG